MGCMETIEPVPVGAMLLRDKQTSLRMPSLLFERAEQLAALQHRDVADLIRHALFEFVNAHAHHPEPSDALRALRNRHDSTTPAGHGEAKEPLDE